jgi:hypothetical protein
MLAQTSDAGLPLHSPSAGNGRRVSETVITFLGNPEFEFVHRLFHSAINTRPQFSVVDLTSACIALVEQLSQPSGLVIQRARGDVAHRASGRRMQVGLWPREFEFLRNIQRSPVNRAPHPRFDLSDLTTACVAIVMEMDQACELIRAAAQHRLATNTDRSPE